MPDRNTLEELLVAERRAMRDWVSIADVLKVMGTNSWVAGREGVRSVLDCIDTSPRLRLGRVDSQYREIPKPLPVDELLDRIFTIDDAADRSFEMMQLFIDTTDTSADDAPDRC
ncbi:hypothetical protein SAMN02745947_05541 [Rhodococcus rhodochrous J3]|uniref:DUF222 domain-containing protein n=1 Tax=Rhodococcus rhodochrous J3 TaxID=903528 RepID=A0ABY1MJA9_RHORH|nr:hypothetical protein [Rhodococcus rhodochrous]MBF4478253.1 hypothetical protein [Rhodococcus rhodochrous]SMG59969.1 hypothetical protein SAMN02745947_05541 [Rhodococcus rhodochrous J3]